MIVFDDKSEVLAKNEKYFIVDDVNENQDVTFKASYIVASDLMCSGKITALFNLVVFGDIEASEIDVKGKLICLGSVKVDGQIVVQNDIWADDIEAKSVVSHSQIFVQSADAEMLKCDGKVLVGKTLSLEDVAEIGDLLICGETAFGAGRIIANSVITAEPIDMDDGAESIEDPNTYSPTTGKHNHKIDLVEAGMTRFESQNDYEGYLATLIQNADEEEGLIFDSWLKALYAIETYSKNNFSNCCDIMLLVKLVEIKNSVYFKNWVIIGEWLNGLNSYFLSILQTPIKTRETIPCESMKHGDVVNHKKFGVGTVGGVKKENGNDYAEVIFKSKQAFTIRKFALPESLQFFEKVIEIEKTEDIAEQKLMCNISSYAEWLEALLVIEKSKNCINKEVKNAIYENLMGYVGLKAKFMNDRLTERGWK